MRLDTTLLFLCVVSIRTALEYLSKGVRMLFEQHLLNQFKTYAKRLFLIVPICAQQNKSADF